VARFRRMSSMWTYPGAESGVDGHLGMIIPKLICQREDCFLVTSRSASETGDIMSPDFQSCRALPPGAARLNSA
jgi:hypothetical protein